MSKEQYAHYAVLYMEGSQLKRNGGTSFGTLAQVQADFPDFMILPANEVPENWRDMSVENGRLVPASAEVLETRRQAENDRKARAARSEREARYRSQTDPMLFDAMEAYALAHPEEELFARWLAAKERIREEVPKPKPHEP